jgi:hypothetical protein
MMTSIVPIDFHNISDRGMPDVRRTNGIRKFAEGRSPDANDTEYMLRKYSKKNSSRIMRAIFSKKPRIYFELIGIHKYRQFEGGRRIEDPLAAGNLRREVSLSTQISLTIENAYFVRDHKVHHINNTYNMLFSKNPNGGVNMMLKIIHKNSVKHIVYHNCIYFGMIKKNIELEHGVTINETYFIVHNEWQEKTLLDGMYIRSKYNDLWMVVDYINDFIQNCLDINIPKAMPLLKAGDRSNDNLMELAAAEEVEESVLVDARVV